MRRLKALLLLVSAIAMPAAGETGTWGVSGTARLTPVGGGPVLALELHQASGLTEGGRPGLGYASLWGGPVPVAISFACATSLRGQDWSWRYIGYGVGSDGGGYRIDLSLDPDLSMTSLQVTKGAPDTCDVGNAVAVWTGSQGAFFAGEGGGVRLDGAGVTAAGLGLEADLTVAPYTAYGLGTVVLTRGTATESLRALCVAMSTPRPRVTWYQLLASSGDNVVYDIHIGDEDRSGATGDTIAVDVADAGDVQGGCSAGFTTTPSVVVDGDFVTNDLL